MAENSTVRQRVLAGLLGMLAGAATIAIATAGAILLGFGVVQVIHFREDVWFPIFSAELGLVLGLIAAGFVFWKVYASRSRRSVSDWHLAVVGFAKRLLVVVACGAVLLAAGSIANSYGSRIRAGAWHLLHGSSATVAGYRIRVPRDWFVEQPSAKDARFWNTRTGESICFRASPKSPNFTLDFWSHVVQGHTGDVAIRVVGRRDLQIAGQSFLCLEQDYAAQLPKSLSDSGPTELHLPSVDCTSTGPLDATFYAGIRAAPRYDYDECYSLLVSIQKQ